MVKYIKIRSIVVEGGSNVERYYRIEKSIILF